MQAAVICSASPSSRDKGDPYDCFRSLDSMKVRSGQVPWALFVCRLVLRVFWKLACSGSRSKFPVVVVKVFRTKFYDPLPSMLLLPTDCLSFVLLQDGARSDLRCFLHELAVEISCCTQYVFSSWTKSFFLHRCTKSLLKSPVAIKRNFQLLSRFAIRTGGPVEEWIMIACRGVNQSFWVSNSW